MRYQPQQANANLALLGALALVAYLLVLAAPSAARAETCPNEARRGEQGEPGRALPECRAYELVSPLDSQPPAGLTRYPDPVSVSGDRIGFTTEYGLAPGFNGGRPFYVSTRGAGGWSTVNEMPPQSVSSGLLCIPYIAAYSADLSKAILADGWNWTGYPRNPDDNGTHACGHDEPLLSADEPLGAQNIFLHPTDAPNAAGFYRLLNPTPPGLPNRDAFFQAGSSDFSHIVFTSGLQLTPEAPLPPPRIGAYEVGENLYENVGGALHLLTILPGGTPTWGILANNWAGYRGPTSSSFTNAVSADGERVFFYGDGDLFCGSEIPVSHCDGYGAYRNANLYLRENATQPPGSGECSPVEAEKACTVQVDEPNSDASPGSGEGGQFQWATPSGTRAFFTDCAKLTADSTAVSSSGCGGFALNQAQNGYQPPMGQDLYEYDLEKPLGHRLTDLSVDHNGVDALGADVQGVAGISKDGTYVYFVAKGVLTGNEENQHHEKAVPGESNLYLRRGGATTFIARLGPPIEAEQQQGEPIESCDWSSVKTPESGVGSSDTRVAPPGPCLSSRTSSSGRFLAFNSRRPLTGYDNTVAATGKPSFEIFLYDAASNKLTCASCNPDGSPPTAVEGYKQPFINQPWRTGENWLWYPALLSSQLSDRGQVFFSTTDELLPADVNGPDNSDVYEYAEGHLHLISTGTSDTRSAFVGASPDGSNVFFTTGAGLVASDIDSATSVYDARVGGGFPEPPPPVVCESEEACHSGHQAPPPVSTPGTAHFEGPGNEMQCPKGKIKKKGKCVAKKQRHKKKPRHHHQRAAGRGQGGSK